MERMIFFCFCVVLVLVFSNEALISKPQQLEAVQLCTNSTGASTRSVYKVINKFQLPKKDPAIKPFLVCFYKHFELQDDDGNMLFDKIKEQLYSDFDKFNMGNVVDNCSGVEGTTPEENAYKATDCILKGIRKMSRGHEKKPKKKRD